MPTKLAEPSQMVLPLHWIAARGQKDYYVSVANQQAVAFLDGWTSWPIPVALLIGPAGSGKTHLAHIFARRANANLADDADLLRDDEGLFHAWNHAIETGRPLLITAKSQPQDWAINLPDLRSRLAATPQIKIRLPDDDLLRAVFLKQWRDRGITLSHDVVAYVLSRIERSFESVAKAVRLIDEAALAANRAITIPLVRDALSNF